MNDTATVKLLFDLAGLSIPDEELEGFVRNYATVRAGADALYRDEFRSESPVLIFDPRRAQT